MVATGADLLRSLLASLLLALGANAYSGDGTAYGNAGGRGSGACEINENIGKFETYYASVNSRQFSRSMCGKCVRVSGAAGSVVAMVVDACDGCSSGDIDLSSNALKKATGYSWDRKPVSWSFTSCGSSDGGSSGGSKCRSKSCRRAALLRARARARAAARARARSQARHCHGKKCHRHRG
ncbi:hypothetical protein ABPG75_005095 [Micractinium tetrahymenae]